MDSLCAAFAAAQFNLTLQLVHHAVGSGLARFSQPSADHGKARAAFLQAAIRADLDSAVIRIPANNG